jgi:hypothetical protein
LINLPDSRIIDPDGPLGCLPFDDGWWIFVGFLPIDDLDFEDGGAGKKELFEPELWACGSFTSMVGSSTAAEMIMT